MSLPSLTNLLRVLPAPQLAPVQAEVQALVLVPNTHSPHPRTLQAHAVCVVPSCAVTD